MNFNKKILLALLLGFSLFIGTLLQSGIEKIYADSKIGQIICEQLGMSSANVPKFIEKCNPEKNFTAIGMYACCVAK